LPKYHRRSDGEGMKAMFAAATIVFWGAWIITAGRIV